jgi:hypothetical protein
MMDTNDSDHMARVPRTNLMICHKRKCETTNEWKMKTPTGQHFLKLVDLIQSSNKNDAANILLKEMRACSDRFMAAKPAEYAKPNPKIDWPWFLYFNKRNRTITARRLLRNGMENYCVGCMLFFHEYEAHPSNIFWFSIWQMTFRYWIYRDVVFYGDNGIGVRLILPNASRVMDEKIDELECLLWIYRQLNQSFTAWPRSRYSLFYRKIFVNIIIEPSALLENEPVKINDTEIMYRLDEYCDRIKELCETTNQAGLWQNIYIRFALDGFVKKDDRERLVRFIKNDNNDSVEEKLGTKECNQLLIQYLLKTFLPLYDPNSKWQIDKITFGNVDLNELGDCDKKKLIEVMTHYCSQASCIEWKGRQLPNWFGELVNKLKPVIQQKWIFGLKRQYILDGKHLHDLITRDCVGELKLINSQVSLDNGDTWMIDGKLSETIQSSNLCRLHLSGIATRLIQDWDPFTKSSDFTNALSALYSSLRDLTIDYYSFESVDEEKVIFYLAESGIIRQLESLSIPCLSLDDWNQLSNDLLNANQMSRLHFSFREITPTNKNHRCACLLATGHIVKKQTLKWLDIHEASEREYHSSHLVFQNDKTNPMIASDNQDDTCQFYTELKNIWWEHARMTFISPFIQSDNYTCESVNFYEQYNKKQAKKRKQWMKIATIISFIRANRGHPFCFSVFPLLQSICA